MAAPVLVNRAGGIQRGLWLSANLVWLALFGIVAFRANEAALLNGLDGAYMASIVERQARWAPVAIGLTNNFLQSLGNVWFPLNAALIPSYAISLWLGGGTIDPVATYVFFSMELFVAAWLVASWIGCGAAVAALAGWLLALCALPYLGLTKVYGILGMTPHVATLILSTVLVIVAFEKVGRSRVRATAGWTLLLGLLLLYIAVSQPIFSVLIVPAVIVFGFALLLGSESRREATLKIAAVAACVAALLMAGVPQFLYGLFAYTAASVFAEELLNHHREWYDVSIAFGRATWGPWGPLYVAAALLGAIGSAWRGPGRARLAALATLALMLLVAGFGALIVYLDFWQGPTPIYFEFMLWPFYAVWAANLLVVAARSVAGLVRRIVQPAARRRLGWGLAGCLVFAPWAFLAGSDAQAAQRSYPYPPRLTPIVATLLQEISLEPGRPFQGRVVTLTGQTLVGPTSWLQLHGFDQQKLVDRFGNDHRTVGLWYYNIPTLFEYSQFITPPFYLVSKTFLARQEDRQIRNVMALRVFDPTLLRALGVRFVITDAPITAAAVHLRTRLQGDPMLYLYQLERANLGQFSPTQAISARDAGEALRVMAGPAFDPEHSFVPSQPLPLDLVPASSGSLIVERGRFRVAATSPGTSVVVLPIEYSHCLELDAASTPSPPLLVRVNLLQAAVLFHGRLDAALTYFTGPFRNADCRVRDLELIGLLGFHSQKHLEPNPL